ncbi:hypothetical protein LBMAG56_31060 [Verrucomicrobiota bacterium]|nr:hypothetical protein LBMAG56_31060 [Verrucomicrobiota bacterium]
MAFLAQFPGEVVLAQVLLRRRAGGFELRHADDADAAEDALKLLATPELRALAQSTVAGAFRPLKSAPNLRRGWRVLAAGEADLETALHILYPGALADWHAAQAATPPVTHYRAFTERQTGMYRITTMLDDPAAERVVRAGCDRRFCLKQRLWTVGALAPDSVAAKSLIPCLEPCAILLELARKAARIEQADKVTLALAPDDGATILAALEGLLARSDSAVREGDTGSPANPRRLLLALEKLRPFFDVPPPGKSAE